VNTAKTEGQLSYHSLVPLDMMLYRFCGWLFTSRL